MVKYGEIKTITQTLREKFSDIDIVSRVNKKFTHLATYTDKPCQRCFRIEWELIPQKK